MIKSGKFDQFDAWYTYVDRQLSSQDDSSRLGAFRSDFDMVHLEC